MPLIRAAAVAAVLALTAAAAGPAVLASWPALVLIAYAVAVLGVATRRIRGRLAGYIPGPDPGASVGRYRPQRWDAARRRWPHRDRVERRASAVVSVRTRPERTSGSVLGPGLLLGAGLGGFVDGILLHQILRWHHLLTARRDADLTANLVADGLFHAATWFAVFFGLMWLWQRGRRPRSWPWTALIGPLLAGWGLFNLAEGLVNHHLLGLHHVRAGDHQAWYDAGFLALGLLLVLVGAAVHRRSRSAVRDAAARP